MSEKNYNELKKSLDSKCIDNSYFLSGEPDLIKYFQNRIVSEVLGKTYTDFDLTFLKSDGISIENIDSAINTFPITTQNKCTILQDLPWDIFAEEDINSLIKILSDIPSFSFLVISQTKSGLKPKDLQKLLKIKKLIKDKGTFSNLCQKDFPMERQLILWAKRDFHKNLSPNTAKKILSFCEGYQIHQIKNELKKICEFEKSNEITEDSLNIAWKVQPKINIFSASKALFSGSISNCFKTLYTLFDQNEDPFYILNIITMDFIDIYRVKIFLQNNRNYMEIVEIFDYKNKEFRLRNAKKIAENLSLDDIKKCFEYIIDANKKLKNSKINFKTILTELTALLMKKIF